MSIQQQTAQPRQPGSEEAVRNRAAHLARLAEISPQQFQLWRHHPLTAVFLQFLADYRVSLADVVMMRWLAGNGSLQQQEETRGQIRALDDIQVLGVHSIKRFYGLPVDGEAS